MKRAVVITNKASKGKAIKRRKSTPLIVSARESLSKKECLRANNRLLKKKILSIGTFVFIWVKNTAAAGYEVGGRATRAGRLPSVGKKMDQCRSMRLGTGRRKVYDLTGFLPVHPGLWGSL